MQFSKGWSLGRSHQSRSAGGAAKGQGAWRGAGKEKQEEVRAERRRPRPWRV